VSHDRSRVGGDGTGSSTGRTGHRSTAASIVRRRAESARPPLRRPGCPRPDVRSGSVPRNASRPHQDLGALGLAGALCAPGYTKRSRKPGSSRQMMLWLTSGHDVPLETARSDHRFTVASMTSRRAGRMWAESAWPLLPGLRCQTIRTAGPGGRIPAGGARVTPAIMPRPGPGPRDRVTPPCCGRGGVTQSFSGRRRWHRQQHWPHRSQINGGFDHQAAGRVGTTPSTGAMGTRTPCGRTIPARKRQPVRQS
jgi:hypothetical protein